MRRIAVALALMVMLSGCNSKALTNNTTSVSGLADARPVIAVFKVSPVSIAAGEKATLQWEVSGTDAVLIEPGPGRVSASGTIELKPDTSMTYTLTAGEPGNQTIAMVTLMVGLPVVKSFTATPVVFQPSDSVTLWWDVSDADDVYIDNGIGVVAASGSAAVYPRAATTYTLTARNAAGSVTAQVVVFTPGGGFSAN